MNANCPTAGWLHRVAAVAQGPVMTGIDKAWSGSFSFPEHILDILGSNETASGEPFSLHESAPIDA